MTKDEFEALPELTNDIMSPGMLIVTKNYHGADSGVDNDDDYTFSLLVEKLSVNAADKYNPYQPTWEGNNLWVELAVYDQEGVCLDRTRADELHTTHEGRIVGFPSAKVVRYEV